MRGKQISIKIHVSVGYFSIDCSDNIIIVVESKNMLDHGGREHNMLDHGGREQKSNPFRHAIVNDHRMPVIMTWKWLQKQQV